MKNQPVIVIGGGISGLSSAVCLARAGFQVELYEARDRLGGLIGTRVGEYGLSESAANGILNSFAVEQFCQDVGVPLVGTLPTARKRYVYVESEVQRWPFRWLESLILIYKLLKHNILGLERIRPRDNETVTQWLGKHFGKFLDDKLFAPALLGIYASRTQDLSASLVFQSFFKGKVNKSPKQRWQRPSVRGTVAPQMGMGELIDGLEKRARELGVVIHLGKTYEWEKWANGRVPHVLATSVSEAVETLRARFPDLADQLGQIQTLPVVSATVFYPQGSSFLHGFGCLFSESEKMNALGVLFPGDLFANRSKEHVETWILGGSLHGEFVHWNENRILEAIATDREKLSGRRDVPMESHIYFWDKALPLYNVELCQILKKLELPRGLWLQGNYLGKIGIAGLIERSLDLPHRIREQGALEDSEQE